MPAGMGSQLPADFYNSFSLGGTTDYSLKDTQIDSRIGRRLTSDPDYNNQFWYTPGFPGGSAIRSEWCSAERQKGSTAVVHS